MIKFKESFDENTMLKASIKVFLEKEGIYGKFMHNIPIDVIPIVNKRRTIYDVFLSAFTWADTPEGNLFWVKIAQKYKSYKV